MTLDELTYDLAGTYDEPASDRPLLPPHLARVSCPLCEGGLTPTPAGWHAEHSEPSCPVRFVRDGAIVPDARGPTRPLGQHRPPRLLDELR